MLELKNCNVCFTILEMFRSNSCSIQSYSVQPLEILANKRCTRVIQSNL